MKTLVRHYDAFSEKPGRGIPAGVVLDAGSLDEDDMQRVATESGFNKTVFVRPSEHADIQLRFFTPAQDVDLCGHAGMAALAALAENDEDWPVQYPCELSVETRAGVLPMRLESQASAGPRIRMQQASPRFLAFEGTESELAGCLGLVEEDLLPGLPAMYAHTGDWSLLVPVRGLDAMRRMQPDPGQFPDVMHELPRSDIHPFCLETLHQGVHMHGRHFASPYDGNRNDAITGTAAGAMGAYYASFIEPALLGCAQSTLWVEQGQEKGKDSIIEVELCPGERALEVAIYGQAVFVAAFWADTATQAA